MGAQSCSQALGPQHESGSGRKVPKCKTDEKDLNELNKNVKDVSERFAVRETHHPDFATSFKPESQLWRMLGNLRWPPLHAELHSRTVGCAGSRTRHTFSAVGRGGMCCARSHPGRFWLRRMQWSGNMPSSLHWLIHRQATHRNLSVTPEMSQCYYYFVRSIWCTPRAAGTHLHGCSLNGKLYA